MTDNIIDAAQTLLKETYPHVHGLEPVALAETLSFSVQSGEFVQILNISRCHWVTISNIGCKPGHINIYDSLPNCSVPTRTKEQIAAIVFAQEHTLTLQFQHVQEQHGSADCGLFAVAFAASLCAGENPIQATYIQHQLRDHLWKCLMDRKLSTFPKTRRGRRPARPRGEEKFCIYCVCRLPEGGRMIQCTSCQEWFHDQCVSIPQSFWRRPKSAWFCTICKK